MADEQQRVAAAAVNLILLKRRRRRTVWVKPWISRRSSHGAYSRLVRELWVEDLIQLQSLLRMSSTGIEEIATYFSRETSYFRFHYYINKNESTLTGGLCSFLCASFTVV
ncbi:hypothetical protein L798_08226 [Zootermopsis nevadensis]|uniref:Uncharacterized protein n=1 Tax=Zootermopsis nevadensis TaxID=136037 RepID=A0A067QH15_ZOONE|nr:hypothetical protein L798_08226 [Zootermopsis nevadensis]